MSCPHCERKSEEIRRLKLELGIRSRAGELGALIANWGLKPTEGRILYRMYAAGSRPVPYGQLMEEIGDESHQDALKTHIHRLRKALGADAIHTAERLGYGLTAPGLSRVLAVIQPPEMQDARSAG